jgi:hypothetical protein
MFGNKVAIKGLQITLHVLVWVLFLGVPLSMRQDWSMEAVVPAMTFNILLICFFYANAYVLIPHVLNKKGAWQYILSIILCIAFILFCLFWLDSMFRGEQPPPTSGTNNTPHPQRRRPSASRMQMRYLWTFFNCLFVFGLSTSYHFITQWNKQQQDAKEQEKERLASELAFLRSQISPHFMFNVLNSMVAMARKKSDLLEPTILKLSQLMRYMLYEADQGRVLLDKEIEYLRSYVALQKMRFGDDVKVDLQVEGTLAGCMIEPMLFIPFVENAFKHGIGLVTDPVINIKLEVKDRLHFTVFNKKTLSQWKQRMILRALAWSM